MDKVTEQELIDLIRAAISDARLDGNGLNNPRLTDVQRDKRRERAIESAAATIEYVRELRAATVRQEAIDEYHAGLVDPAAATGCEGCE